MKKVFIASMASVIAALSMAGCGGSASAEVTAPAPTAASAAAETTAAQTTAAETSAAETTSAQTTAAETSAAETTSAGQEAGADMSENEFLNDLNKKMEYFNTFNSAADTTAETTAATTAAAETPADTAAPDDELISMRVGDADHGFITVPKTWNRFQDASGTPSAMMQYCDGTENNIISMTRVDKGVARQVADNVYDSIQADTNATITGSRTCEVDGKEAYRIDVHYTDVNKEMYVWVVQAEGAAYYLAVEYTDPDVFELARTYSTEK